MRTRKSLSGQCRIPEAGHVPGERYPKPCPSLLRSAFSDFSLSPPKHAADDPLQVDAVHPPAKTRASRCIAECSIPPVPDPFTRSSIANTLPHAVAPSRSCENAGKKRVRADDCDENTAPSASVTSRKKRLAARPRRKVKRLPLREELEVLREALPSVIRDHLDPPRDDKGPIPNERRTLGEFLRWKSMYNDELVDRIADGRHVVCRICRKPCVLCHDTAYNWYKWGKHRERCIEGMWPDWLPPPPKAPTLLHDELPRRTGRPEVDALFPKTKGGPYYRHSWTYFVPRPGQSRPDDPSEAPPRSSSALRFRSESGRPSSARQASVKSDSADLSRSRILAPESWRLRSQSPRPYRPCPWSLNLAFKAEEEPDCSNDTELHGMGLLLAASRFLERTNVQCTTCVFPRSRDYSPQV